MDDQYLLSELREAVVESDKVASSDGATEAHMYLRGWCMLMAEELAKKVEPAIDPKESKVEQCNNCNESAANGKHTCPYQEDVNNDKEYTCNCCEDCEHECAMEI